MSRTRRIEELFHAAAELRGEERADFLGAECGEDRDLLAELEALLAVDERASDDLASPVLRAFSRESIGPYRIVRELGRGGMGTVYLVEQDAPVRRELALKLMRARVDPAFEARFHAERQACARMQHPGIAKIFDAGVSEDGLPYFAMELVRGLPIVAHCEAHGVPLRARVALLVEVCRAVQHAHQNGVIHRDLKPSNILVDASGEAQDVHPKIIDFGVAKLAAGEESEVVTLGGQLLGTPEYMSPEQAAGASAELDTRCDVYALGVILYELVTGTRPFAKAGSKLELLRALREDEPPPPSAHAPGLARELDWIALRALEREPERRYASASELGADLERFLRHEPVLAAPPSPLYRVAKFARRKRGLVAGLAVALLALALGFVSTLWQVRVARRHAQRAERHLEDYRRMADVRRVQDLMGEADEELWPARPERAARMRAWLDAARALLARRAAHEARVAELDAALADADAGADRASLDWQRSTLASLLQDMRRLEAPDRRGPTLASVAWRLERAEALRAETVEAHARAWREARASIADPASAPAYGGLEIEPQLGLVPLGQNAQSGLWEFWHPASGARPEWSSDGRCALAGDSGVVLVLVPPGSFHMGAERPASGRGYGPNLDPHAGHVSRPVHELALDAFFLGRFEFTQGQWRGWTGENPARLAEGAIVRGQATGRTNPVERVRFGQAQRVLRQLGLALPTEAQWEYACRAGTRSVFERGNRLGCVQGKENLADEASRAVISGNWNFDRGVDDGFALHAPVGSFAPSRWGFFDMHGNVAEWCLDAWGDYELPHRPGDGLRLVPGATVPSRVVRGGSFYWPAVNARSAERHRYSPNTTAGFVGLRAARALER